MSGDIVHDLPSWMRDVGKRVELLERRRQHRGTGTGNGGGGAPTRYTHVQSIPSDSWVVTHGLGARPEFHVEDAAGSLMLCGAIYNSNTVMTLTFHVATTGTAYFV